MKVGRQGYTGVVHLTVMKKNHWAASVGIDQQNRVAWCAGRRGIHACSDGEREGLKPEEITCQRCAAHLVKLEKEAAKREKDRLKEEAWQAKIQAEYAKK